MNVLCQLTQVSHLRGGAQYMLGCFLSKSTALLDDHISLPPVSNTLPSFDREPGYTQQDTLTSSVGA